MSIFSYAGDLSDMHIAPKVGRIEDVMQLSPTILQVKAGLHMGPVMTGSIHGVLISYENEFLHCQASSFSSFA